ncbi:MAG: glutamate-1-semialdehyde 2,1-aminomutase [Ignavibacteriales bacterium]
MNKPGFANQYPEITNSIRLLERAKGLIPAYTQTLAKGPGQYVRGIAPHYLKRGKGARVWDVDGNEYIDYNMAIGPVSLGYAFEEVDNAIVKQLHDGITFSMMHELEVEVAELIREVIPNAESVRFSKTGADVTSAAIRLARAFTKKKKILCCGYHGWHDWYISVTDRNLGIPDEVQNLTYTFNYNDLENLLDSIDDETAAVILEPFVFAKPDNAYLKTLRDICTERNILLIFDEMWTGFRIAAGGAQEYFDVKADLACFSKAIANGMPLSVLCGRADIMKLLEKDVFFFTTFGGETLSLAAAKATIEYIRTHNVPKILEIKGTLLQDGYNDLCNETGIDYSSCTGYPCRSIISFNHPVVPPLLAKSYVQQELIKHGIIWSGFHTVSYSHTEEDISLTLMIYRNVLEQLDYHVQRGTLQEELKGKAVEPVFRRTTNFNTKPLLQKAGK